MASHDIDVENGSQLHVLESGQGLGPVLLLHGLNESAVGYGPIIRQLESRLHLFAPDLLLDHFGEGFVARLAGEMHRADPRTLDPVLDGTLFDGFDPDRDLPRITFPTRLIAGNPALGGAMRGQDVERVARLIHLCSERVWGDVGHDIHTVRPEAHSKELMEIVDQVS